MKRRKSREKALMALYQADISEIEIEKALENVFTYNGSDFRIREFAKWLAYTTWENRDKIDSYISKYSIGWKMERLANVDRNILRIAICEMLYGADIPYKVSIDEAVELAKKYSTEKAAAFINGILDSVKRELEKEGNKKKN
ncbi:MAG TPA: transcription antitermination factor NusB [Peptococcaceae bacterium]|nr:MAG: N utilization substance protein B-like protein [Clostridia bacterium 41_269]HBT20441.1 transcription antitermination factor NusB [Peptococcaceae bacterium]